MRVVRLRDPAALAAGVFTRTRPAYDKGPLAAEGVPAIVAEADVTSGVNYTAGSCPGATLSGSWTLFGGPSVFSTGAMGGAPLGIATLGGNQPWQAASNHYYESTTPGDTFTLVTTAYRVDLFWFVVSNGGIAHITVDGQAIKGWDTSSAGTQPLEIDLDGQSHTIIVTNKGDAVIGVPLLSSVTDTTGVGLAACLGLTRNGQPTQAVTWTVQATSSSAVEVKNGGTVIGTLNAGSSSDALIPGYTLALKTGTWTSSNVASVVTEAPALTIGSVTLYSALYTSANYAGPVLDSGYADTEWPLLEYAEGPIQANTITLSRGAGQTAVPDATWTWQAPTTAVWSDPSGGAFQRVVNVTPGLIGRYSQTIATFSGSSLTWASNITVFTWRPQSDPFRQRLNPAVFSGPKVTIPLIMVEAAMHALQYQDALDFAAGSAALTAQGSYLTALGAQFGVRRLQGEPTADYQGRVALAQQGLTEGGSQPWLQAVLSGALGCTVSVSPFPRVIVGGIFFPTTFPGLFGQNASGYWRWSVVVPFALMRVPPETVTTVVNQVRPLGSVCSILYQ